MVATKRDLVATPRFHLRAVLLGRGLWDFGRGLAHLRTAHPDSARLYLDRLYAIARATPVSLTYGFVGHRQADLLNIAAGILAGELAASEGRYDDAVKEEAVQVLSTFEKAWERADVWLYSSRF